VQVASFKLTGKRVFRMAPIHHHFEQLGWTEPQIVIRFWIVSGRACARRALHAQAAVMLPDHRSTDRVEGNMMVAASIG